MNRCANCGRRIFKVLPTPRSIFKEEYWAHRVSGGGDTDCRLHATLVERAVVIAAPPGFTEQERRDFNGRVENAADSIIDNIVARRADTVTDPRDRL